jgi:CRP-like cAMP-binding protein
MSLDRTIGLLQEQQLFAAFDVEALRILAFSTDRLDLTAGARLFSAGEPADSAFLLISGEVELIPREGKRSETVGAGALIGELGIIIGTDRPATAVVRRPSELLRIPRQLFRRLLEAYPQSAALVAQRIAERLRELTEALETVRGELEGRPAREG